MENAATRKKITVIPQKARDESAGVNATGLLRVAAYCRVSTDKAEQEMSYERQCEHFTKKINENPNWQMVKVYADEGISGKAMKSRPQFLEMLKDCRENKIDRILVKTISRFARNTVECMQIVRELKGLGIGVSFEKEGFDTLTPGIDLVLTILASCAEEESRTMSTNIRWTWAKKFENGECIINHSALLGYGADEDKNIIIIPEEAAVVRRIFNDFLAGRTIREICTGLMEDGIKSKRGSTVWHHSGVHSILSNEKYMGDTITQKTYSPDFLIPRRKNNRDVKSYYIENSHPAIISKEQFANAQTELKRRKEMRGAGERGKSKYSGAYPFSSKLFCSKCGSVYRRYARREKNNPDIVWLCTLKQYSRNKECQEMPIKEDLIINAFQNCLNELLGDKVSFTGIMQQNIEFLKTRDNTEELKKVESIIEDLQNQMAEISREIRSGKITKDQYNTKYGEIAAQLDTALKEKVSLIDQSTADALGVMRIEQLSNLLSEESLTTFSPDIFRTMIDKGVIYGRESIEFYFKAGFTRKVSL